MTLDTEAIRTGAQAALELAEQATKGPWLLEYDSDGDEGGYNWATFPTGIKDVINYSEWEGKAEQQMLNGTFIAASRQLVPALAHGLLAALARVAELEAERDALEYALAEGAEFVRKGGMSE